MQATGTAAHKFYRAFHRWSVHTRQPWARDLVQRRHYAVAPDELDGGPKLSAIEDRHRHNENLPLYQPKLYASGESEGGSQDDPSWLQLYLPGRAVEQYITRPSSHLAQEVGSKGVKIDLLVNAGVPCVLTLSGPRSAVDSAEIIVNAAVQAAIQAGRPSSFRRAIRISEGMGKLPPVSTFEERAELQAKAQQALVHHRTQEGELSSTHALAQKRDATPSKSPKAPKSWDTRRWIHLYVPEYINVMVLNDQVQQLRRSAGPVTVFVPSETCVPGLFTLLGSERDLGDTVQMFQQSLYDLRPAGVDGDELAIVVNEGMGEPVPLTPEDLDRLQESESNDSTASLRDSMRATLRSLTNPVVLVTVCDKSDDTDRSGSTLSQYRGVTLSSFTAVTLDPNPFVSFNIRTPSRTYDAMSRSKEICIHVLAATSAGASIAHAFTQRYEQAHEPFEVLKRAGATVSAFGAQAPKVQLKGGVIAYLRATCDTDSCLTIGDHKVCAALIRKVSYPYGVDINSRAALAYGARQYRFGGDKLVPSTLPTIASSDENVSTIPALLPERRPASLQDAVPFSMPSTQGVHRPPARHGRGYPTGRKEYNAKGTITTHADTNHPTIPPKISHTYSPLMKSKSSSRYAPQTTSPTQEPSANGVRRPTQIPSRTPWGLPVASSKRSHSTIAHPLPKSVTKPVVKALLRPRGRRPNTSRWMLPWITYFDDEDRHNQASISEEPTTNANETTNEADTDVDPVVLKQTVGDFLCHSKTREAARIRQTFKMRARVQRASEYLETSMAEGTLEPKESQSLEQLIAHHERFIAKRLAEDAALDLSDQLDNGHVSPSRVQHLELCVERGQAALIGDAKDLRIKFDNDLISEDRFEKLKKAMVEMEELFRTVKMRLRDLMEEED